MIISMNFLVPSAVYQIYLISHFCSPDHPEYITVSRQVEPAINGYLYNYTNHACMSCTHAHARYPSPYHYFHDIPTAFHELWDSGQSITYNEVLNILNIWKTNVFVLSATGQVVVDTVFSKVGTVVC